MDAARPGIVCAYTEVGREPRLELTTSGIDYPNLHDIFRHAHFGDETDQGLVCSKTSCDGGIATLAIL